MFNRYSYKIGNFVVYSEKSYRHPNDFERRWNNLDNSSAIFTSQEFSGVVVGLNNFHIPEGSSEYVVEIFCPETGKNLKIGIGNKSPYLRKANRSDFKRFKFPSELEIEAHNSIFSNQQL